MPYICVTTSAELEPITKTRLEKELGSIISVIPGKSERWLMTAVNDSVSMTLGGSDSPCAMVSVAIYGSAKREDCDKLTANITALVAERCGISPSRIYVSYTEHEVFGWNGSNF